MTEIMINQSQSCDLKDLVQKFIPESIGKEIEKATSSIYPLQNVFIRKVKILKAPKFDLGRLMEASLYYSSPIKFELISANLLFHSLQLMFINRFHLFILWFLNVWHDPRSLSDANLFDLAPIFFNAITLYLKLHGAFPPNQIWKIKSVFTCCRILWSSSLSFVVFVVINVGVNIKMDTDIWNCFCRFMVITVKMLVWSWTGQLKSQLLSLLKLLVPRLLPLLNLPPSCSSVGSFRFWFERDMNLLMRILLLEWFRKKFCLH